MLRGSFGSALFQVSSQVCLAGTILVGMGEATLPLALQGSQTPPCQILDPCLGNPNAAKCIGLWDLPRDLCFPGLCSPREKCLPDITACNTCTPPGDTRGNDEIGHVALIPRNDAYKGYVIFWTACGPAAGYRSHLYNPLTNTFDPVHPPFVGAESPFCSAGTWVFDENKNPKLLTVGGSDGGPSGSEKAFWFDPLTLTWSGDPVDLSGDDGNWYPSIATFGIDATHRSAVIVMGGSPTLDTIPSNVPADLLLTDPAFPGCPPQFDRFWTLNWPYKPIFGPGPPPPVSPVWTTRPNAGTYESHQYPRGFVLSQNFLLTAGHEIVICEDTMIDLGATQDWGGNAVQVYNLSTEQHLAPIASLDPNVLTLASGHQDIFGWNSNCAVLQHTLKPGWDALEWPTDAADALSRYDLDRVLVFGGLPKFQPTFDNGNPRQPQDRTAHRAVLELQGASNGPPSTWNWREKARPVSPRIVANAVLLPDGRILFVGGQQKRFTLPLTSAELFDPQGPLDNGTWKVMRERPAGSDGDPIPRTYHNVALLLPGGEVTVMGGADLEPFHPWGESMHTVDLFKPPYWFFSQRPSLGNVPEVIRYPSSTSTNTFCVQTNKPDCILRACLIGVGSVTHHFDYGQRYIELMTRQVSCSGGNTEVFPPPNAGVVPPGFYMLFLVDVNRLPSVGTFVKVDY